MIGQELGLLQDESKLRVECLVLAEAFETFWAYYLQSSGHVFETDCRDAALKFIDCFDELSNTNPKMSDPEYLSLGKDTNIKEVLLKLKTWASGKTRYPYETHHQSRLRLWSLITAIKARLIIELGLRRFPNMAMAAKELEYSENYLKWKGHLPPNIVQDVDALISRASLSSTIVVVGDIRKSQDLMTYSRDAESFSSRIVEFITQIRLLLNKHYGFFDKFTGDGFLAYFNETICEASGKDFQHCFIEFLRELLDFSQRHFSDWIKHVKKLPPERVGLAIGADLGVVSFQNLDHHLVVVGDAVVWASRMSASAHAAEVVVNNLLFETLRGVTGVAFEPRLGKTKSGEEFSAHTMRISSET